MIIELMLMLIVVGAGIVFVSWSNSRRRRQEILERREVEASTGKLKQELERTANEIIGRMEKHVAHLETMLDESERNRIQLEGRVVELKKVLKKAEGQSGEIKDLIARLEDSGAEVDGMQRKMATLERRLNVVMSTPLPVQQPIQQPVTIPQMTPPPIINPLMTPPQITTAPPAPPINPLGPIQMPQLTRPPEPDKAFDKILEETLAEPPKVEEPPPRESIVLSPETKKPVKVVEADPVKIETTRKRLTEASAEMAAHPPEDIPEVEPQKKSPPKRDVRKAAIEAIKAVEQQNEPRPKPVPKPVVAQKKSPPPVKKESSPERRDLKLETTDSAIIKEMLLAGMSIEEISRETGLGRGAIELIQEMTRRQLNRK